MRTLFIILVLALASCSRPVTQEQITYLNGLWEIEQVTLVDGSTRDYKVSEIIDEFSISKNHGTRKKVRVSLVGNYPDAAAPDSVIVRIEKDRAVLAHKAEFIRWEEEIVELDSTRLVLKNKQGITYQYKRHAPFELKP